MCLLKKKNTREDDPEIKSQIQYLGFGGNHSYIVFQNWTSLVIYAEQTYDELALGAI